MQIRCALPTAHAVDPRVKRGLDYGMLTLVTVIWGSTFLITRRAVAHTDPFLFLAIRFSMASLLLIALYGKKLRQITAASLKQGILIGAILFLALALQTVGAPLTTVGKAGFLVGLSIPAVPLLGMPILRKVPGVHAVAGILLSFIGLALISLNGGSSLHLGSGEWMMIGAALTTALHIVVVGKYAPRTDATLLAVLQIATVAVLSGFAVAVKGGTPRLPEPGVIASAGFMALFATAFALVVMTRVQQNICSTKATLIYAMEPVWAGGFGVLAGEALRASALGGCGLIFTGVLIGAMSKDASAH
jgi:drug/metabolite transporter (DMT)-like permease